MAKDCKAEQQQLSDVFRMARQRADKDLEGFSRAFRIRDQLLSGGKQGNTGTFAKKAIKPR